MFSLSFVGPNRSSIHFYGNNDAPRTDLPTLLTNTASQDNLPFIIFS